MEKLLIYDCEIIRLIPDYYGKNNPNYSYCKGWRDFKNMGISVIGTWRNYDLINILGNNFIIPLPFGKYEAFVNWESVKSKVKSQKSKVITVPRSPFPVPFKKFYKLYMMSDRLIGFNSISFDDKLCGANGLRIKTDFDLLAEVREAVGMPRHYVKGITRGGYNLQNLALKNLGKGKTGTGEFAPKLWQDGRKKEVINYCLNDVALLRSLYFRFVNGLLRDPHSGQLL